MYIVLFLKWHFVSLSYAETLYPSMDGKEATKEGSSHIAAQTFAFRELAAATKNFRPDCLLGEGGFGRVYKGRLESTNQVCLMIVMSVLFSIHFPVY